jgi:hypothetical protein
VVLFSHGLEISEGSSGLMVLTYPSWLAKIIISVLHSPDAVVTPPGALSPLQSVHIYAN